MNKKEVKNLMASYRIKAGYTLKEMAEKLGVAYATMQKYENKPYSITVEILGKLFEIYGEDFRDIFFAKKLYYKYK